MNIALLKTIKGHPLFWNSSLVASLKSNKSTKGHLLYDYITRTIYIVKWEFDIDRYWNVFINMLSHEIMHSVLYDLEGYETARAYDNIAAMSSCDLNGMKTAIGLDKYVLGGD